MPLTLVNDAEVWNFAFSEMPAGAVPRIFEDPESGVIVPAASEVVTITFDASLPALTPPGIYSAALVVAGNDLNFTVPVTMTVRTSMTEVKVYLPLVLRNTP